MPRTTNSSGGERFGSSAATRSAGRPERGVPAGQDLDEDRGVAARDTVGHRAVVDVLGCRARMQRDRGALQGIEGRKDFCAPGFRFDAAGNAVEVLKMPTSMICAYVCTSNWAVP